MCSPSCLKLVANILQFFILVSIRFELILIDSPPGGARAQVTCGRGCESYLVAELAALGLGSQVTPAFRGAFINDLPRGLSLMEGLLHHDGAG